MSDAYGHDVDRLTALGRLPAPTDADTATVARLIQRHALDPADAELLHDALLGPLTTAAVADPVHSHAHYQTGCRHQACIAAHTRYQRDRRAGRIVKYQGQNP